MNTPCRFMILLNSNSMGTHLSHIYNMDLAESSPCISYGVLEYLFFSVNLIATLSCITNKNIEVVVIVVVVLVLVVVVVVVCCCCCCCCCCCGSSSRRGSS